MNGKLKSKSVVGIQIIYFTKTKREEQNLFSQMYKTKCKHITQMINKNSQTYSIGKCL